VSLNTSLAPLRRRLTDAHRTRSQRDATGALARRLDTAAAAVNRLQPELAANRTTQVRLVDGLHRTAAAYRRLSTAAAGSHRAQWNAAATAARRDEGRVASVVSSWSDRATVPAVHFTRGKLPALARPRSSKGTTTSGVGQAAPTTNQATSPTQSASPSSSTSGSTAGRSPSKPTSPTSSGHVGGTS
jgi:hypothetical protein